MNRNPESYVYTHVDQFMLRPEYRELDRWRDFDITLDICPNSGVDGHLAEVIGAGVRYATGSLVESKIQVPPGYQKHILVTRGQYAPPDVYIELFVFGTGTYRNNPIPIVGVHHKDAKTVYSPHSSFSGIIATDYILPIVPNVHRPTHTPWQPIGHGTLRSGPALFRLTDDIVNVRPIVEARR